jgi:hypothetical protein
MGRRSLARGACRIAPLLWALHAWAGPAALEGGAYEVEVRLELPHLEDRADAKVARLCLSAEAGRDNHGLAVLSENNPLARCPFANAYEGGDQISFDIVCEGRNAARAKAHYVVGPGRFRGRITMQMGGKNMTMTEVQVGRRVGACAAPAL